MKLFKHKHDFHWTPKSYEEAFQKIIVEHKINVRVTVFCECGATANAPASVVINIHHNNWEKK